MHDGICIREITSEEGNRLLRIVRRARSTVSDARAVMNPGSTGRGSRLLIHDQRGLGGLRELRAVKERERRSKVDRGRLCWS